MTGVALAHLAAALTAASTSPTPSVSHVVPTPSPSVTPLVINNSSGSSLLAVLVQLAIGAATVAVAFLVMRNGFRSTTNVDQAARRTEWWKRAQWAIDLALDDDGRRQEVGVVALNELLESPLADQEADIAVGRAVMTALLPEIDSDSDIEVELEADVPDGVGL
jgi:uncharacterized protein HemX